MLKKLQKFIPFKTQIAARTMNAIIQELTRISKISGERGIIITDMHGGIGISQLLDAEDVFPFKSEIDPDDARRIVVGLNRGENDYQHEDEVRVHFRDAETGDFVVDQAAKVSVSIDDVKVYVYVETFVKGLDDVEVSVKTDTVKPDSSHPDRSEQKWWTILGIATKESAAGPILDYTPMHRGNIAIDYPISEGGFTGTVTEVVAKNYNDDTSDCYTNIVISKGVISQWPRPANVTDITSAGAPIALGDAPVAVEVTADGTENAECFELCLDGAGAAVLDGTYRYAAVAIWTQQTGGASGIIERVPFIVGISDRYSLRDASATVTPNPADPIYFSELFTAGEAPCPDTLTWTVSPLLPSLAPAPTFTLGICGKSALFNSSASEFLSNGALGPNSGSFTSAVWAFRTGGAGPQNYTSRADGIGDEEREFFVRAESGFLNYFISTDGTDVAGKLFQVQVADQALNRWDLIIADYNSLTGTMSLGFNGAPGVETTGIGSSIHSGTASYFVGSIADPQPDFFDGRMDKHMFFNTVLTPAEKKFLFNNGFGRVLTDFDSTLLAKCIAYHEMDELSGSRQDSRGSFTLSDNGTVGQAIGVPRT